MHTHVSAYIFHTCCQNTHVLVSAISSCREKCMNSFVHARKTCFTYVYIYACVYAVCVHTPLSNAHLCNHVFNQTHKHSHQQILSLTCLRDFNTTTRNMYSFHASLQAVVCVMRMHVHVLQHAACPATLRSKPRKTQAKSSFISCFFMHAHADMRVWASLRKKTHSLCYHVPPSRSPSANLIYHTQSFSQPHT